MSKILHLTLKKRYFDMIASGEKKEEYREIKPHWITRFVEDADYPKDRNVYDFTDGYGQDYVITKYFDFTNILAKNGYAKDAPAIIWKHEGITIGEGKPEWGAEPGKIYFILKIGELIK
jgi:hypothetical protein